MLRKYNPKKNRPSGTESTSKEEESKFVEIWTEESLYFGSYLRDKRIKLKHVNELAAKFFMPTEERNRSFRMDLSVAFELITGIIERFGQQWLARDYLEENRGYTDGRTHYGPTRRKAQYHFDAFIIFTKSNFDFIAHLLNGILELGHRSKNVDLSHADFRNDISNKSPTIGTTLNNRGSWINQITAFRTAIEHQKVVPVICMIPGHPIGGELRFPLNPLSFTERMSLMSNREIADMGLVLPFCDTSLTNTREIIEETFALSLERLQR